MAIYGYYFIINVDVSQHKTENFMNNKENFKQQ